MEAGLVRQAPAGALAAIELRGAVAAALVAIEDHLLPAVDLTVAIPRATGRLANAFGPASRGVRDLETVVDDLLDEMECLLEDVADQIRDGDPQAASPSHTR